MPVYTTPPGNRFGLDVDGTSALIKRDDEANWVDITSGLVLTALGVQSAGSISRSVTSSGGSGRFLRLRLLFPETRTLLGLRWNGWTSRLSSYSLGARYSTDTTDGINGTWTAIGTHGGYASSGNPSRARLRTDIAAQSIAGVRGLEFLVQNDWASSYTGYFTDIHVYGTRDGGDHLTFWHPTLDQALTPGWFDFGDILRGVTQPSRQFRVKNVSPTKTANGITASYGDLDGAALEGLSGQFSLNDTTWANNISLGNLAPGVISPVGYFRVSTSLDRPFTAPAAGRLAALPTSWTG